MPTPGVRGSRVLILTAEVGDGHVAAARALACELAEVWPDAEVEIGDALDALGRPLRLILLDAYRWQLRHAPWIFAALFALFLRVRTLRRLGAAHLALLGGRSFRRYVAARAPDIVVSTYPSATTVLGHLRRRGRLGARTYATITDLAGAAFWAHAGIDLHFVMHAGLVPDVERAAGTGSAIPVRPLVGPAFREALPPQQARRELELPAAGAVVLVSGGGWGIGDLATAVEVALELPEATVVCLAGRDARVRRRLAARFAGEPRVRMLGFSDRMPALLAAADVLVHSTGGVTCLEAFASGCPVIAFGAPPGHARLTAAKMAQLGLGRNARTRAELREALGAALAEPRLRPGEADRPAAAAAIARGAGRRVEPRPVRRVAGMRAALGAATLLAGVSLLATDAAYPLAGRVLGLQPLSRVRTARREIALVVAGDEASTLFAAAELRSAREHASFAFVASPGRRALGRLAAAGDQVIPQLRPTGFTSWFAAGDRLQDEAGALGLRRDTLYLAPGDGFSLGAELVARVGGRRPVTGSSTYGPHAATPHHSLRPGEVVALDLPAGAAAARVVVGRFLTDARRAGVRAVTLDTLVADRRR